MRYFPSVEDFNLDTCTGKVLYLAHCDLDPIKALIEQTKISTQAMVGIFGETAIEFDEKGEHYSASQYFDMQSIFAARVVPLSYQSVLLILFSVFEEAIKTWCRMLKIENDRIEEFDGFLKGRHLGELERAIKYIEKYSKITGIEKDLLWDKIKTIRTARNAIVHNGGRVEEKYRKHLKKFNIGMREEDFGVYIDYETISDIYDTIMEFVDRIFSQAICSKNEVR
ncbi:hypothetical protein [Lacrimispora sp.]|uniref:hypothetical protein n=1 Tax=Lacrimispora sp. TaxID=2719234 RepID=UPI0028A13CD8|nr:hypothetical protein [Lacrimispora sp.]